MGVLSLSVGQDLFRIWIGMLPHGLSLGEKDEEGDRYDYQVADNMEGQALLIVDLDVHVAHDFDE